jgi:predicted acetyltransferase
MSRSGRLKDFTPTSIEAIVEVITTRDSFPAHGLNLPLGNGETRRYTSLHLFSTDASKCLYRNCKVDNAEEEVKKRVIPSYGDIPEFYKTLVEETTINWMVTNKVFSHGKVAEAMCELFYISCSAFKKKYLGERAASDPFPRLMAEAQRRWQVKWNAKRTAALEDKAHNELAGRHDQLDQREARNYRQTDRSLSNIEEELTYIEEEQQRNYQQLHGRLTVVEEELSELRSAVADLRLQQEQNAAADDMATANLVEEEDDDASDMDDKEPADGASNGSTAVKTFPFDASAALPKESASVSSAAEKTTAIGKRDATKEDALDLTVQAAITSTDTTKSVKNMSTL